MSKSIKNSIAAEAVMNKLHDIETDRINWEEGSYKKSNDELYSILDRCLVLYQQVRDMQEGKLKAIKSINAILVSRGMKVQNNTSLVTKIVRYVFGDCGKRAFAYARVILAADANKPENQSLHAYIAAAGGIEEIRKSSKLGAEPKPSRKELIESAEERLETAPALISGIKLIDELQPNSDTGQELLAVLMRKEPDGTASIVYGCTSATIIGSLLAASERDATAKAAVANDETAPGKAADARANVIAEEAA